MWRSPTFRRIFSVYGLLAISLTGVLALALLHQTERRDALLIWVLAPVTAASLGLAFWLARRNVKPLQELIRGAKRIAAGEYGHKVYAVGGDELGQLARSFNHMSERLAEQFAQLEEDRQQLRGVLSGMVEGVVAVDADQRILFTNDRAGQLLEFAPPAMVSRKLWEVVRHRALQEIVRHVLEGPESQVEEADWKGPAEKDLLVRVARLSGPTLRGAVLVFHDITELRRLERLRQEFVANVSHELKTPLAVIKACVETLLDGAIDDPEHRTAFLQQLTEQADRLHVLILDLLSLARIESKEEAFDFQEVSLEEAVRACVERHRARAESKNQQLSVVSCHLSVDGARNVNPDSALSTQHSALSTDCIAWADAEAVNHILDNLVDNALKYTPPGGRIQLRWRIEEDQACLEVEDTGIGIPERDLPRIFERFYRVDKARAREVGGTGLGLAIVKHLVQAMHGSVRAVSRPGEGSTFQVRLPRADTVTSQ